MTPLSHQTLWGWKRKLVILGIGVEGLCALVPERVAFRVTERFITARSRLSQTPLLVAQGLPPCEGLRINAPW